MTYTDIENKKIGHVHKVTNGWLGITDKYWAATLMPDTKARIQARILLATSARRRPTRPTTSSSALTVAPGATAAADTRLFAGAKEVAIIDGYEKQLNLNRFDLLIDWGWFHFITKPMFMRSTGSTGTSAISASPSC